MAKLQRFLIIITLACWGVFSFINHPARAGEWYLVRNGISFGISGMVLMDEEKDFRSFAIVHDNKRADEGRLAIVTIKPNEEPEYLPLSWPDNIELPVDLEGLTAVPSLDRPSFMASTSRGKIYHFQIDANQNISVLKVLGLPGIVPGSNFEAFAIQIIEDKFLAVWAHRGSNEDPAVLYWGWFDPTTDLISLQGSTEVKVPWPIGNVRHISDLKIDPTGKTYITSATDNGNDGPFESAVYMAGTFGIQNEQIQFEANPVLEPLYQFDSYKAEGIELIPGFVEGVAIGTDDENMGSRMYLNWQEGIGAPQL